VVLQAHKAHKVRPAPRVLTVPREPREIQGLRARPALQVRKALLGLLVHRVHKVTLGHKARPVHKVVPVRRVLKVLLDHRALRVRKV
jgi:hypothetical protein